MVREEVLRKISRILIYSRDMSNPKSNNPIEFSKRSITKDIECIDGWLSGQFKTVQDTENNLDPDQ